MSTPAIVTHIRIGKCSDRVAWYANRVGQVLEVEWFESLNSPSQGIPEDVYWCRTGDFYNTLNYVRASDASPTSRPEGPEEGKPEKTGSGFKPAHSLYLNTVFNRKAREKRMRLAIQELTPIPFDAIAVRGVSGLVFGSILADRMQRELVVIRKSSRTHSPRPVEGIEGCFSYVIVDDCIASGSTVRTIQSAMQRYRSEAKCLGLWLYDNSSYSYHSPDSSVENLNVAQLMPSYLGLHPAVNTSQQP